MVPAATDRPAHREASPVPLIRQRWSIENEWHWARDAQLGEDAHRNTYCTGVLIPAHGGDEPAATRGLPLDSPGPAGARLRHQGNAGPGRGGGACSHELITLLGSPGNECQVSNGQVLIHNDTLQHSPIEAKRTYDFRYSALRNQRWHLTTKPLKQLSFC